MDKYFLFDVDGTLTPSRGKIDKKFKKELTQFIECNPASIISGSDYIKTVEQIGDDVVQLFEYSFNCSGNAVYQYGELIRSTDWMLAERARIYLNECLEKSSYPDRWGNHLEERVGAVNFSVIGRNCSQEQRKHYYEWDKIHQERAQIAKYITDNFTGLDAVVGGEISIDIYPTGGDKSQVLKFFRNKQIIFFGDKCLPGGNDYPLSSKLPNECVYFVKDWQETRRIIKKLSLN